MSTDPTPNSDDDVIASQAEEVTLQPDPPATTETNEADPVVAKLPKIAIGSQRDVAEKAPSQPKAVEVARKSPILVGDEPLPVESEVEIKSMAGLGEDIDAEIEDALAGFSMDSVVDSTQAADEEIAPNSRVKATVSKTHGEHVFFKLLGQYEGVASLSSFKTPPADGDMLEVIVREQNAEDGLYEVAIPGSSVDISDWEDLNEGDLVACVVTGSNTGGLEVTVSSLRGFIPASQIDRFRVENFGDYVNQKLNCIVAEVNPQRKKLVLSRRAVLERENEEKRKQLLETIEVGQLHDGVVTKLMDFGAFVDIGGIEGLVHVSKLSWERVSHPKDVLEVGQKVQVKLEKIDIASSKMSLSYRDTLENPWDDISAKYPTGQVVPGTVTRIAQFGAFVRLEPGVEGLVHISELAHHRVVAVKNHVNQGDEVQVKVLSVEPDKQKIGLSIKATQQPPKPRDSGKKDEIEELPDRPLAVAKRNEELKGGTDRQSGGESVGLNW